MPREKHPKHAEIVEMVLAGRNYRDIANSLRVGYGTIMNVAEEARLPARMTGPKPTVSASPLKGVWLNLYDGQGRKCCCCESPIVRNSTTRILLGKYNPDGSRDMLGLACRVCHQSLAPWCAAGWPQKFLDFMKTISPTRKYVATGAKDKPGHDVYAYVDVKGEPTEEYFILGDNGQHVPISDSDLHYG